MAHFLFRVFNHLIKTFARPFITMLTSRNKIYFKSQQEAKGFIGFLINKFIYVGNFSQHINNKINQRFFNIHKHENLSKEKALEKGIEFVSEAFIYSLILSIPIYEYYKISLDSKKKLNEKKKRLEFMISEIDRLSNKNSELLEELLLIREKIDLELEKYNNV